MAAEKDGAAAKVRPTILVRGGTDITLDVPDVGSNQAEILAHKLAQAELHLLEVGGKELLNPLTGDEAVALVYPDGPLGRPVERKTRPDPGPRTGADAAGLPSAPPAPPAADDGELTAVQVAAIGQAEVLVAEVPEGNVAKVLDWVDAGDEETPVRALAALIAEQGGKERVSLMNDLTGLLA